MNLFSRFYRLLFNPTPVPRQTWYIDGVGYITVILVGKTVTYLDKRTKEKHHLDYYAFRQNSVPHFNLLPEQETEAEIDKAEEDSK